MVFKDDVIKLVTLVDYFDVWGNNGLDPKTGEPVEEIVDNSDYDYASRSDDAGHTWSATMEHAEWLTATMMDQQSWRHDMRIDIHMHGLEGLRWELVREHNPDAHGFQVNDMSHRWTRVLPTSVLASDASILRYLQDAEFLRDDITLEQIEIDECYEVSASYHESVAVETRGIPICRLEVQEVHLADAVALNDVMAFLEKLAETVGDDVLREVSLAL